MSKNQAEFMEYLEDKNGVFDVCRTGRGVSAIRDNTEGPSHFDSAKGHGWYLSLWDSGDDYNLAVFMPIEQ